MSSDKADADRDLGKLILGELDHHQAQQGDQRRRTPIVEQADPEVLAAVRRSLEATAEARGLLEHEPFIGSCRLELDGSPKTLLISRLYTPEHAPKSADVLFVSYLSPLGRAMALPLGQKKELLTPGGRRSARPVEKDEFRAARSSEGGWDAQDNSIARAGSPLVFIPSFRALLAIPAGERAMVDRVAPEISTAARPLPRRPRQKLELRDQATLDELQDPIFRMPVDARIVVTGAPGTGKTTLIIKRISQKTRTDFLEAEETKGLTNRQLLQLLDPRRSWVLFTPTELLRGYLTEAFARESLPASAETVRTWDDERSRLARDVFRYLRVGRHGRFKRTSEPHLLVQEPSEFRAYEGQFRDFLRVHDVGLASSVRQGLAQRVEAMTQNRNVMAGHFNKTLLAEVWDCNNRVLALYRRVLEATPIDGGPVRLDAGFAADRRTADQQAEGVMERALTDFVRLDSDLLQSFGGVGDSAARQLVDLLRGSAENDSTPEEDHPFIGSSPIGPALALFGAWLWCHEQVELQAQDINSRIKRIGSLYKSFRVQGLQDKSLTAFFAEDGKALLGKDRAQLDANEADLLLSLALEQCREELESKRDLQWAPSHEGVLDRLRPHIRTFIAVDEATDFSVWQLGCMYRLTHPHWGAFSMSGDLMQRVTTIGIRSWQDCSDIPGLTVYTLRRVYRQSRTLLRIASALYEHSVGEPAPFESPFPEAPEPAPLLLVDGDRRRQCRWIAERILEVYERYEQLPSIAVFVPTEHDVRTTSDELQARLDEHAIDVEPCFEGKVLGTGDRVRVFSLGYIKGLEFEAAFLIDFDSVYADNGDLGEKYLYLGLTRATTFLGITVRKGLPQQLSFLEAEFTPGDWRL